MTLTTQSFDATTGALSAAQIYGLLQNLPPRFRTYDSAKPVWMANVAILNAARQIPAFAGAVASIVNDQTADGIPEMLGIDFMESSAMSALNTVGAKNPLLGDMSQYIIVDRQPNAAISRAAVQGPGDRAARRGSGAGSLTPALGRTPRPRPPRTAATRSSSTPCDGREEGGCHGCRE
jgi:hypothetical protein